MSRTAEHPRLVAQSAEEQAAAWFARHRSGAMTAAELGDWEAWLAADPTHSEAFGAVQSTWHNFEKVRAEPGLIALREAAFRRGRSLKRWKALGGAAVLAASVALVVVGLPLLGSAEPHLYLHTTARIEAPAGIEAFQAQEQQTTVGERRVITLADGSIVTLDTDTAVHVAMSPTSRLVMLSRGRAFFEVAKDPSRPFIVFAGDKRIMAVGTAFDVELGNDHVEVVLREGKVRVEGAPTDDLNGTTSKSKSVEAADLVPGTRLKASSRAGWTLAKADVPKDLSWLSGQLVFNQRPLGEVVTEMNRYSLKKITLGDASLATVPISGVFAAGHPDALADALEAYKLARVASRSSAGIVLKSP